jgi:hypothetical protein
MMSAWPEESDEGVEQPEPGADPKRAGARLKAALGLTAGAILTFVLATFTDPQSTWGFVTLLGVAFGLSVGAVYMGHLAVRSSRATSAFGIAVVATVVAYLVLLPLTLLLAIWATAGIGSV